MSDCNPTGRDMDALKSEIVDEIKAAVAQQLEKERLLLRRHLEEAQNEIKAQLAILRYGVQQLRKQQADTETSLQHVSGIPEQEPARSSAQDQNNVEVPRMYEDVSRVVQQIPDSEIVWFKEQINLLQEEQRRYSQELRRQENQQQLQQTVSVSKFELQDEHSKTKVDILSSIKAMLVFTEAELGQQFHDSTSKIISLLEERSPTVESEVGCNNKTASPTGDNVSEIKQIVAEAETRSVGNVQTKLPYTSPVKENLQDAESKVIDSLQKKTSEVTKNAVSFMRNLFYTQSKADQKLNNSLHQETHDAVCDAVTTRTQQSLQETVAETKKARGPACNRSTINLPQKAVRSIRHLLDLNFWTKISISILLLSIFLCIIFKV